MQYVEIFTLVLFAVLFSIGYKKNNRNMMLTASLCLLIGFAIEPFVIGFEQGIADARN
ncbi:MAG: hypothetical protein ACPGVL_13655 [Pseudoalteromonas spongiae]|uniref:Uncharacterized protein n=1 Tax=Pseudoalteromonas spongiae TaxID=298657 RepID=A0ABU8EZ30_9GAMM|nr:hypothetical protein [Pseudoalteromonas spongiae]ATD01011.1 hypothetical protein PSPO_b1099 [Pseudoalteromonas spongiae UST010723-006]MEC8325371.1 hypothetical protein [Pseudomonadota bacterium]